MHGHNWLDERGAEGIGYVRAVGILLPQQIARIGPQMRDLVREQYEELFASAKVNADGMTQFDFVEQKWQWLTLSRLERNPGIRPHEADRVLYQCALLLRRGARYVRRCDGTPNVTTRLTWHSARQGVHESHLRIQRSRPHGCRDLASHAHSSEMAWQLLPRSDPNSANTYVIRILGPFIHARHGIQAKVFGAICGTVEKRLASRREAIENPSTAPTEKYEDMIQWIIDTAPLDKGWGSRRIAYEVLALWFGASHALASTAAFALYDLCTHREHIPALRAEVDDEVQFQKFLETSKGLPLLDSFIKESTRLSPMEAMSGRRMALQDFTFSDGTVVKKGDWTCIPLKAMQADPAFFPSPDEFHPFRFLAPELRPESASEIVQPEGPSRLTDASANFYYWGAGKIVCPGRFYVGVASKLLISYILHDLDVELVDKEAKTAAIWRSYILPMDETYVRFRRRQD